VTAPPAIKSFITIVSTWNNLLIPMDHRIGNNYIIVGLYVI